MKGLEKVVWAEGVFLGQQHFQAWDRYQSSVINFQRNAFQSNNWGVISLSWDEVSLTEGRLEIVHLKAIFPNGRMVDYHREVHGLLSLELFRNENQDYSVSIILADNDLVEDVAGYPGQGRNASWTALYQELTDENDFSRQREVMLAQPLLKLSSALERSDKVTAIECLRVQRLFDGAYQVVQKFVPPCLQLRGSQYIASLLQNTVDLLAAKVRDFTARRAKLGDIASFSSIETSDFFFNKQLVDFLFEARNLLSNLNNHPILFYELLGRLHQHCAVYLRPEFIDHATVYQHEKLGDISIELLDQIREMLSTQTIRADSSVQLTLLSPGRYQTTPINEFSFDRCHFYLAVDSQQTDLEWIKNFTQMCKLAAPEKVELLVASGLAGVEIKHCHRLPQKVRIKSGFEYFEVSQEGPLWQEIRGQAEFAIFCLADFSKANIELLVVERSE
ncbi:type VI secretion system baseplate subunit TssK [Reinekea sp.]|jgi:type VI secretion system protein ImpJ|uniref:type VI secretion system baseplate subunit TssK n=1 Tax=Reinekea sp. TaxID=1970455 RepID=UPI00398A39D9